MRQPTEEEREDARIERLEERERWTFRHAPWCMSREFMGGQGCDCRVRDDEEETEEEDDA